jgi:Fe-S cluster assembly protein SufD
VVEIPADAELDKPIELQAIHGAGQVHSRFPVRFGKGSKATVIERHLSVTSDAALVSSVSDIVVEDGAESRVGAGLADAGVGQVAVVPAGEQVASVPLALAVAEQHETGHQTSGGAGRC